MSKKRIVYLLILTTLTFSTGTAIATDLYWYLAASMTKPGKELVTSFNSEKHPFKVVLISGGSGLLLAKISSSRKGDLYTPAAMTYAQHLEKIGLVASVTPLLIQTPVFALSTTGKDKVNSWEDLMTPGVRIGLGNPKTMALGKSYEKIKKKMSPDLHTKIAANKVVDGLNVSQIVNYLKTNIIDAGISFDSTARANKLDYIVIPKTYNHQEIAPLIRLKSETNRTNSDLFIKFIAANMAIFKKHGFQPANR